MQIRMDKSIKCYYLQITILIMYVTAFNSLKYIALNFIRPQSHQTINSRGLEEKSDEHIYLKNYQFTYHEVIGSWYKSCT